MQANAIVFQGMNQVGLETIELPQVGERELLVRTRTSVISIGTERWALTGRRPEMKYPHVPGYLAVGIVEQAGTNSGYEAGERIFYTSTRLPEPYASNSWMGTHLSHAIVPVDCGADWPPYICRVPEGVSDIGSALCGLAAVAVQGADMLRITSKDTALVLGLGLIGQSMAQVLRARGARVVVADMVAGRVASALTAGAHAGIVLDGGPLAGQIKPLLPALGADIVVDTTSVAPVVQQLGELVRPRGQISLQGYYPGLTAIDLGAWSGCRPTVTVPCSMDLLSHEYAHRLTESGALNLESLLSHSYAPSQAPEVYQQICENPAELLGVAFDWT